MSTNDPFIAAAQDVTKLSKRPGNDTLLKLYALYKQGESGDITGSRPGLLDIKGRKKFDSWASQKGLSRDEAKNQYVTLVNELKKNNL